MYIETVNGVFYAVDAEDGSLRWEYTDKKYGQVISPGVDEEHVYLTAGERYQKTELHAVN